MGITADRLLGLGLIDEIVSEPLGGAHRDVETMAATLKAALLTALEDFDRLGIDELMKARYARLMKYGAFEEA